MVARQAVGVAALLAPSRPGELAVFVLLFAGRVAAPTAAACSSGSAGYGPAFPLVAVCREGAAALLLAAERAAVRPAGLSCAIMRDDISRD